MNALAWRVASARVTGRNHPPEIQECQDYSGHLFVPGGVALALADGAGSARWGAAAADAAVRRALDSLESPADRDAEDRLAAALAVAAEAIVARGAELGVAESQCAATLLVALCTPSGVFVQQIGDSRAVVRVAGEYRTLAAPHTGEYQGETLFLRPSTVTRAHRGRVDAKPEAIFLMTDGVANLAIRTEGDRPVAGFFDPLYRHLQSEKEDGSALLQGILSGPQLTLRCDDDMSLLVAVPV